MAIKKYFPVRNDESAGDFVAKKVNPEDSKSISKIFKVASLALGYQGTNYYYAGRSNFEPSPYDFERILQAVDTDSYVKQAVSKYKDLFWRKSRSCFLSIPKNRLHGDGNEETILGSPY
jgi:hypothetical protein